MEHYTSIEQSKKLLELGLNPDTADMMYCYWENSRTRESGIDNEPTIRINLPIEKCDIPCWSVGSLIKVIPDLNDYTLLMARNNGVFGMCFTPLDSGLSLFDTENETLIDTCVEFILRLLENGYIKK